MFLIPNCGDPNNFLVANVLPVNECVNGVEYSCGSDGSTVVSVFNDETCGGKPAQQQVIAGPGECVQGLTFDCRD